MVTPQLLSYIETHYRQGVSLATMEYVLKNAGWEDQDIQDAYSHIFSPKKSKWSFSTVVLLYFFIIPLLCTSVFILYKIATFQQITHPVAIAHAAAQPTPTTPAVSLTPIVNDITKQLSAFASSAPARKSHYSIVVYGDSMVDTMGENLEYLAAELHQKYPTTTFSLYNYGVGSQNVDQGIGLFAVPFEYKTRHYPPLSQLHPDIFILGSFAYNPFTPYERNRHWLSLGQLVKEAKTTGADVYMLSEIAPLGTSFGKGPNGVQGWTDEARLTQARKIIEQLENAVGLAQSLQIPLINMFAKTADSQKLGSLEFTNSSDGIHPSQKGHTLTAKEIVATIGLN